MTRRHLVALWLVLPLAVACARGGGEGMRARRAARIEQGLAAHRKLMPWLQALPQRWATGYSSVEKQLFLDASADCVTTYRIGTAGDGGKWLCNPYRIAAPCVVYGAGAGPEISFELAMAEEYGCEVHVFDPSQESVRNYASYENGRQAGRGKITYHPWGLGPVSEDPALARRLVLDGVPAEVKTLAEIAKLLGHSRVDVLKVDIEGGELSAFPEMLKDGTLKDLQTKQLLIEFHAPDLPAFGRFIRVVGALEDSGYLLFRKELNPYAPGTTAEYAFAERGYLMD